MIELNLYQLIVLFILFAVLVFLIIKQRLRLVETEKIVNHTHSKLEQLQQHFGRFTPQEVIEHFTEPDGSYAPRMKHVTVLFADLRGFTKMCSQMDPSVMVSILNGYFRCMSKAITDHHGQVTDLLGDGLLALFGAVRSNPWQVPDAVMAAIDMREALVKYNQELKNKSLPELSFGMGIDYGELLVGVMGTLELSKFGVVGDTINVASRVESLTSIHDVDLLITENVKCQLDERFVLNEMPPIEVKGKEKAIVTYFVESVKQ